ncbi:MAG: hypothetical protein QOD77_1683 [Thermoplasmata archaeon]|jgi:hypothetical protein|nr:hypothetical protein [Thermoplasmata archaeon]
MRKTLSPTALAVCLALFTALSWAAVAAEAYFFGGLSVLSLAPAVMFTTCLVVLPFLGGIRVTAQGLQHALMCQACGAVTLPHPRIAFCLRCGAYPKASATPAQR